MNQTFNPVARYNRPRNYRELAAVIRMFLQAEFGLSIDCEYHDEDSPAAAEFITIDPREGFAGGVAILLTEDGIPFALADHEEKVLIASYRRDQQEVASA